MQTVRKLNNNQNEKLARALSVLNRKVGIILHPSRVPTKNEISGMIFAGDSLNVTAMEYDVRQTLTTPSVQQGKFTDRLKAWENIKTVDDLSAIFKNKRLVQICNSETDINKIKSSLTVKQLTMEEFKKLAEHGSQEVLSLDDYLNTYQDSYDFLIRPPKMAINLQDPNSASVVLNILNERNLLNNVYIIMERDIDSFNSTSIYLAGKQPRITLGFVPSSDILKNEGAEAFRNCIRSAVVNSGAKKLCIKISEIQMVLESVPEEKRQTVSLIVYVPPKEFNEDVLIKTAATTPQLDIYQVDNYRIK